MPTPEEIRDGHIQALQSRDDEIARLRQALEDVVNPLGNLRRYAEDKGTTLNGMAYSIANDLGFVQEIARKALTP